MTCKQCMGIETMFDEGLAMRELEHYRRKGPARETRMLLETLREQGVNGASLLDIGGGVGAIQHELVAMGVREVTDVDASTGYLKATRQEAARRGYAEQVHYHHGDFTALAPEIEPADIVTLDRVICCYPHMEELVSLSAARARRLYAAVYPRDNWLFRIGRRILNSGLWLKRSDFQVFVHATGDIDAAIRAQGLEKISHRKTLFWQVVVYARPQTGAA